MDRSEATAPRESNYEGLRVIDFTHIISGPYCSKLMADLGAEVIKVEPPVTGDTNRWNYYMRDGVSGSFLFRNGGKKSLSLNLKHPQGVAVFKDLARVSDIVVQNWRVGMMDRLGIGYETLREINPRLIMVSISGYGLTGPLSDWPANDANIQAMSGAMGISGHADGPPLPSWVPWVDFSTGAHALAGIGAALYYRDQTGRGQHIDMSMFDAAFTFHDFAVEEYLLSDGKVNRTRTGPNHPSIALMGVFQCRDGYIFISAEKGWAALTELMGRPELATDPRFDTRNHRLDNKEEVIRIVSDWMKDVDMEDARILLEASDMIALPILSIAEAVNSPHVAARELFVEIDDPRAGRVKMPNIPFKFSDTTARVRGPAPMLGQHNDEILGGVLGYSWERIHELWQEEVIYAEEDVSRLMAKDRH